MIAYIPTVKNCYPETNTTGPNSIDLGGVTYSDAVYFLCKGARSEDILEANNALYAFMIEDQRVRRFLKKTYRKEGREQSKVGWLGPHRRISRPQIKSFKPQHPFRISMGGADE